LGHNSEHRNPIDGQIKHPTVKSIPCMERLIELCSFDNATVFDGFTGSGTTALACLNTNRNFVGFELDADYYEIGKNRIEKLQNSKNETLF
jgi:site-specific DNA-methyltransferase (adenine-specific)